MWWDYHIYFWSLLNILLRNHEPLFSWRIINLFFKFLFFSIVTRSKCSLREVYPSYTIPTPKIIFKMSSFIILRSLKVRNPSLLIHSWHCKIKLLIPLSFLIYLVSFSLFKRWWRIIMLQTKGLICFCHSRRFMVFSLIVIKL